jgi:serine/threonine-protein kinase RsbW
MGTIQFEGEYKHLKAMADFVMAEAHTLPFSNKELYAIELAMDEAASNVIDHAYKGEGLGHLHLTVETVEDGLKIVLEDHGRPFDPSLVAKPDLTSPLELRSERGLGVYTMYKMMDLVEFDFSEPGTNRLTMIKKVKKAA